MIAVFGLIGGQHFAARHVESRAEGEAWHAAHLAMLGEDQSTLQAYRESDVLTHAEAKKLRYRDGTCPFGHYKFRAWVWTVETVDAANVRIAEERAALEAMRGDGEYELLEWLAYRVEQRANR